MHCKSPRTPFGKGGVPLMKFCHPKDERASTLFDRLGLILAYWHF